MLWLNDMLKVRQTPSAYHDSLPWQEFEQERDDAFHPMVLTMFLTPLLCVAALKVVVL